MSKRLRYLVRFAGALLAKYWLVLSVGAILGTGSFWVSGHLGKYLPQIRGTNTMAVVGRYTTTDIPLFIQHQISQGLTTLDPSGLPAPAIATSWEVSTDGRTYTFQINTDLKWQDGTTLTNRDINYQFRDAISEYLDTTRLVMKLTDPFAPLPVVVSRPVFKSGLLGTGSYQVTRLRKNGPYIDTLWLSPVDKSTQQPHLVYKFYASEAAARTAFKLGAVRAITDLQDLADMSDWPGISVVASPHTDRYVGVFFNTTDPLFSGPTGRDSRFALAYAIDKSRWPDRVLGPISQKSWAYTSNLKTYDLDLNRAQQLLDKIGKTPQTITLSTVPAYLAVAEDIKSDWEKLGMAVNVVVSAEPASDFQALVIAQQIPADPDQYNLWHSTQETNITRLNNPRIDKLLEDGRKSLDITARKKIYQDFQRFLVDEAPVVFLFHPQSFTLTRK